jgi:hypothetical protein
MCPHCHLDFIPWRAWRITRWSSFPCPNCSVALSRRIGVQSFAVMLLGLVPYLLVRENLPWIPAIIAAPIFGVVVYVADVFTVRLTCEVTDQAHSQNA